MADAADTPQIVLPFPVRQWAARYVEGLSSFLAEHSP
jgi:hypothetical protein